MRLKAGLEVVLVFSVKLISILAYCIYFIEDDDVEGRTIPHTSMLRLSSLPGEV